MTLDDFNRQLIKVLWQGAKDIDKMCKEKQNGEEHHHLSPLSR